MKTSLLSLFAVLFLLIGISSCNKEKKPQFILQGTITGADSATLYLERLSLNEATLLDSAKLNSEGKYKFEQIAPQFGEFYLLKLGNKVINVAIDSIETVTINADKSTFAGKYTVEGSKNTVKIKEVVLAQNKLEMEMRNLTKELQDKTISQNDYVERMQSAINEYKELATNIIREDYNSLAAYFALFQKVDDLLIFDPYQRGDRSLFQATATIWLQTRPDSPRTKQLETFVLSVLSEIRNQAKIAEKLQTGSDVAKEDIENFYNISLPDITGKKIDLGAMKGKAIILDFTAYQADYSPAHNILLNKVYEKYKTQVEIYQVSFDADEHLWKNAAYNLPWTCVWDARSFSSEYVTKFNIKGLPTAFLINKNGDIVQRLYSFQEIESALKKVL